MRALLLSVLLTTICLASEKDGKLDVYWIDVEGGGATLIVTPAGESVLIDTGNPGPRDSSRIAKVAREVAGLRQIDHAIITHFHIDHFGGAAELAQLIPITRIYDHGEIGAEGKPLPEPYQSLRQGRHTVLKPGDTLTLKQRPGSPALTLTCLAARQQTIPAAAHHKPADPALCAAAQSRNPDKSDNANSIVMLLRYGSFDFFDGGDLTWNTEAKLTCPTNLVGEVDVYQVNHHGLDVSNNPVLVKAIKPTVAVMNNGDRKGCGPITADTLRTTPSIQAVYQVHECVWPSPKVNTKRELIANHGRAGEQGADCKANHIHMSVAADGANYTLSIPATGHTANYQTR